MFYKRQASLLLLGMAFLLTPILLGSQEPELVRQLTGLVTCTIGQAGNHGSSSTQWLRSTLGQPQPVGRVTSRNFILEAGFWPTIRGQSVSSVEDQIPRSHQLDQAYPNPFNPNTTIRYALSEPGPVNIALYDLKGGKVRTLVQENQLPGWYTVRWNGQDDQGRALASGVYFCRMQIGDFKDVKKMTLLQ